MADDESPARARVAALLQRAGDRLRGVFNEGPDARLLEDLRDVEPTREPLGLRARALGVLSIDSEELAIVVDGRETPPKLLVVPVAPGAVAISGGVLARAGSDGAPRDGYLRWAVLRVSPERVAEWTFAARTADRVVAIRDRAMLVDASARDDLAAARTRLHGHRVAVLAERRYAMLIGESRAKVVLGRSAAGEVVAVALDFSP